ncbi:MAG: MFS transporter [Gammaproteobacteria bacterium]|nr:MFS transporter [Gammaproteobacteria bacterium]
MSTLRRILFIAALVIGAEMIFGLPFHVARFFRPTFLEVFGFSNTQLGDVFAVYGITAMLSYFPGGVLADYFSARRLITLALMATAAGGLYMATIPGAMQMAVLYGYFGITTIFLSWGAMIRATREWGGASEQGVAFGTLEAGRGLAAALVAGAAVLLLARLLPAEVVLITPAERLAGLRGVIYLYASVTFAVAVFAWLVIPDSDPGSLSKQSPFLGIAKVVTRPQIWAQAAIIVSAYCLYKSIDNYALYAQQVLGMDEVSAARLSAYGAYVRPVAALAAGFIADRLGIARSIAGSFALSLAVFAILSFATPDTVRATFIIANLFVSLFAVFALRGIYFALLEETRTPQPITGTAVGMVSFIGFTPDIFFGPVAGRILDANPGTAGHLNLFALLASIALAGVLIVFWLLYLQRKN